LLSSQNYLVKAKNEDDPFLNNYITSKDTFQIINNRLKINKLYVKYFRNKFPMPQAPFSINNIKPLVYKPDSTWIINMTDSTFFNFNKKGIYHFQTDSVNKEGLTLYYFSDNFPVVNTPESLLKPLQYLTTSKEYNEYLMYASKKEAVDDFWLRVSGNTDRAKELIRVYYNRVMLANKYFSSFIEGWETDRGMIYIIFGLPTTIYKSDDRERWIYGKNENMGEMVFDFIKTDNPLSRNDYNLLRFERYKNTWYLAVETWRDGRMFSVAN
jgi:GWxTD domain-containing protein